MAHRILLLFGLLVLPLSLAAQSSDIEWIVWNDTAAHYDIAISPDGKRIAATTLIGSSNQPGPYIWIYSAEEGELDRGGELLHVITNEQLHASHNTFHSGYSHFGFLTNTSLFVSCNHIDTASATWTASAVLLSTDIAGEQIDEISIIPGNISSGLYASGFLMYYGNTANSKDFDTLIGLDLHRNRQTIIRNHYPISQAGHIQQVAISPDGSAAAFQQGNKYWIVETATGQVLGEATHHSYWKYAMFLPDQSSIALVRGDNTVQVVDFETGRMDRRIVSGALHFSFLIETTISPDGRYLAAARADGTIYLWNLRTGEQVYVYDEYQGVFTDIEFTPDGQHLIATTLDGALISWKGPDKVAGVDEEKGASGPELSCTPFFNPATGDIRFTCRLPERAEVRIDLYNLQGNHVGELARTPMEAGEHEIEWNAGDIPSGVYFYRLNAGERFATGRIAVSF